MIRIVIDSSSDYTAEEAASKNLTFIPIRITMGDNSYRDGVDFKKDEFFEMLPKTVEFPKTSQPSPQEFLTVFKEAKEKGDSVICILLSSGLSGTCQSAVLARNMVEYDNIYIVDSLGAACMIRFLIEHARTLVSRGHSAAEIADILNDLKKRVRLMAVLDTLEYLSKGGRVPKALATIGEIAKIKPVITITEDGEVGVLGKCIGKNKAASHLIDDFSKFTVDTDFPFYTIYSYGTGNCENFEAKLLGSGQAITDRLQIGATIGAHIGHNAYGIVFVSK